jgi:ribosomal protein S6--L-glutamate ligase
VFDRFEPPVVLKPTSTTRGVGVARAGDLDSFLGLTDYVTLVHDFPATGDKSFLVQEFLPDARDVRVMVVDGEYAGAVERRRSDETGWTANVHRGAEASGIALATEHRRLAERVAAVLDIDYLGVDLLLTEEGAVVSETNARPTIDAVEKYEPGFWDGLAELIRATANEG